MYVALLVLSYILPVVRVRIRVSSRNPDFSLLEKVKINDMEELLANTIFRIIGHNI